MAATLGCSSHVPDRVAMTDLHATGRGTAAVGVALLELFGNSE
jgi:hypothetical protein